MKNWIKLNLHYLGTSKKHEIFRAIKFNKKLENILKMDIYNERYVRIGKVADIFGPVQAPFLSIKKYPKAQFNPKEDLYVKI